MRRENLLIIQTVSIILAMFAVIAAPGLAQPDEPDGLTTKPSVHTFSMKDGTRVTVYGKAFLLEKPHLSHYPPILHVQGTPYEMGYQHGVLLAPRIQELVSGVGSPMMFMLGGWEPESGKKPTREQFEIGRAIVRMALDRSFIEPIQQKAPDYYEEARGIADGLKAVGSPVRMDDVLAGIALAELTQSRGLVMRLAAEFAAMHAADKSSENCSDFAAWGKATENGKLVHGTNYDNEDFTIGRNGVVLIARPESGNAFLGMIHPGSPWPMRGMSEAGITVGEPTSNSNDNDILAHPQAGHCVHMRRVLQYADSTQEAVAIMQEFSGSTGWNIFVTDGKVPTAVDIQVSSTKLGVVYPVQGSDMLWSTNQFTAFPGYQGYPEDGTNLVKDQMEYWGVPWNSVDTITKWQDWLRRNKMNDESNTWARYERLRELGRGNYGHITAGKVITFMSDPVLSDADPKTPLSGPVEHLYGIERPIISQGLASVFSAVFLPADGIAYIAMGAEPAQAGTYWPVNLADHLELMASIAQNVSRDTDVTVLEMIFDRWIAENETRAK
jgi:hypothetical protein